MSIDRNPATLIDVANACQLVLDFVKDRSKDEFVSDMLSFVLLTQRFNGQGMSAFEMC